MNDSLFDFHSHILPRMDDGAQSIEISFDMLSMLSIQGVDTVFATPHFLPMHESPADFIKRRKKAFDTLKEHIETKGAVNLPQIKLGAEIQICRGISEQDLSGLEYEGTEAFLLELPRESLSRQIVKEIYNLCRSRRFIPVIAHIDRYEWFKKSDIAALAEIEDVVFGFNTDALSHRSSRKTVIKMAKQGARILFGSDTHNTDQRPPTFNYLTGDGGKCPLSSKEQELLLDCHIKTTSFIFREKEQERSGLFF